jgi:hypothetical protein
MTFAWHCRYRLHAAAAADVHVASIPFSLVDYGLCVTACSQILHDATPTAHTPLPRHTETGSEPGRATYAYGD